MPIFVFSGIKNRMKRIKEFKNKLLFTALLAGILFLLWYFDYTCVFLWLFGIPCPGCGMARAFVSLARFDLAAAFSYHPMFWSVPILYLYMLFDGELFGNKLLDRCILFLIGGAFAVSWIVKLFG